VLLTVRSRPRVALRMKGRVGDLLGIISHLMINSNDRKLTARCRGLGMIQFVRYSSTPVGPYDEMVVIPGYFASSPSNREKPHLRVTRAYVSQRDTCLSGRKNWNIPKHLARFSFVESEEGLKIEVYPSDTTSAITGSTYGSTDTGLAVEKPFFKCTIKKIPYVPAFPFTTSIMPYLGFDVHLLQPPLPASSISPSAIEGEGGTVKEGSEVAGTNEWRMVLPKAYTKWAKCASVDMRQSDGNGKDGKGKEGSDNWWPGMMRWTLGLWIEDGTLEFPESSL
jgi:hypothetical protein